MDRETFLRLFFFAAFAAISYQLILLATPFLPGLLGAAMLAVMLNPLRRQLRKRIKNPTGAAVLLTLAAVLLTIVPLVCLGITIVQESRKIVPVAQAFFDSWRAGDVAIWVEKIPQPLKPLYTKITGLMASADLDIRQMVLDNMGQLGSHITLWGGHIARNALLGLFNVLVMMIALFFVFRNGEQIGRWVLTLIPLHTRHKEALASRAYETFRAVVVGFFVTAAAQGLTAMVGFWVAGVRLPVLLGVATSMAALLGASAIVTIPVALVVLMHDRFWGIALLIWGGVIVGVLDNFLKPYLIGAGARMPLVLIFFGIIGGLKLYGFSGFILGPVLLAAFFTFVKIYQDEYIRKPSS